MTKQVSFKIHKGMMAIKQKFKIVKNVDKKCKIFHFISILKMKAFQQKLKIMESFLF